MLTKQLVIFSLTLLLSSCSANNKNKVVKIFPSGKTEKEIVYSNPHNILDYSEITYFENGHIKLYQDFYDGRFNGKIINYYKNGKKKFEGFSVMGLFIGTKINYDTMGQVLQIDSLEDMCEPDYCCCDGTITRFYANGKVKERFKMESGEINGILQIWTTEGKIKMERTYALGILNGPTTEFYDTLIIKGQYINGKEEGDWKYFDNFNKVIQTDTYKEGRLINN
jgi:antitoxin component YwqK of YwqJK toxin-antitoxin module